MIVVRQHGRVFVSGNCQNLTPEEVKALLTRVGEGSKVVLSGDEMQCDLKRDSGLTKVIQLAKKYMLPVSIVEFTTDDIVRSDICKMWVETFMKEGL